MYNITENKEYNSVEVSFDDRPSEEVRNALKGLGFRWHATKKVWFGRKTVDEVKEALSHPQNTQETEKGSSENNSANTDKQARKARKQAYIDLLVKAVDRGEERWKKYYNQNIFDAITLSTGEIIEIENHDIKTSFCYGHGFCGVSTDEDEDRANRLAEAVSSNEQFFIDENMEDVDCYIKRVEGWQEFRIVDRYYTQKDNRIKSIVFYDEWNDGQRYKDAPVLSDEDKTRYVQALKEERENFLARLKTYLKRYGLSKVTSWSYLSD